MFKSIRKEIGRKYKDSFAKYKDEKLLDLELSQINTEHQAATTEYDSVKSLISDNVEKSFSLFG